MRAVQGIGQNNPSPSPWGTARPSASAACGKLGETRKGERIRTVAIITVPSNEQVAMAMWPVSTRVSKPEDDDRILLDPAA